MVTSSPSTTELKLDGTSAYGALEVGLLREGRTVGSLRARLAQEGRPEVEVP